MSYRNNPDLKPEYIRARAKLVYERALTGRTLISPEPVPGDSVSWLVEGDIVGQVDWISDEGGFPNLDFKWGKDSKPTRPFGARFTVSRMERLWHRAVAVGRKINRTAYRIRAFEDNVIYNAILTAGGANSVVSSVWNEEGGDPLDDIQLAKQTMKDATDGIEPDTIIMSDLLYRQLIKYDFVKNALYTNAKVAETGYLPQIAGLRIVREDKIDPFNTGQYACVRSGDFGYIAESIPFTTASRSGEMMGNPLIDNEYFCFAMNAPVIDSPEMIVIMTGAYNPPSPTGES